jgi:hypothetical protein
MDLKTLDSRYMSMLRIRNPSDSYKYHLHPDIPKFDSHAYEINPIHRHLYDKLFIVKSQHLPGGTLQSLNRANIKFPIFIKPRWGHLTSSSKDCYIIRSLKDLEPHWKKPHMIWSGFIDAKECMTDFILVNGFIVHQITYLYSNEQTGFADVWKYVSPDNKPPDVIVEWVSKHAVGYSGPLNVQYRDKYIIEVGMRFARGGMYIQSTDHKQLIDAINEMWVSKTWMVRDDLHFQPFYTFKCWCPMPIMCLLPNFTMDAIMKWYGAMDFYDFYFEPTGTHSLVFYQFLHRNFKIGMQAKSTVERVMLIWTVIFYALLILAILGLVLGFAWPIYGILIMIGLSAMNSLKTIKKQFKNQKQFFI